MVAIKKKNNRNDYYNESADTSCQPALSHAYGSAVAELEGPMQRIATAAEAIKQQLTSDEPAQHVLVNLRKLTEDCETCRNILFRLNDET